jgi:hypothetical protein
MKLNMELTSLATLIFSGARQIPTLSLKETKEQVALTSGADRRAFKVTASMIPRKGNAVGECLSAIEGFRSELKTSRKYGGTATSVEGTIIIPAKHIPLVNDGADKLRGTLVVLHGRIRDQWDDIVDKARTDLAGLVGINNLVWPTADDYIAKLTFSLRWLSGFSPLSQESLAVLGEEVATRTRIESERQFAEFYTENLASDLESVINYIDGSVSQWNDAKRIKGARFDNLRDRVLSIRERNWFRVEEIDALCDRLEQTLPIGDHVVAGESAQRNAAVESVKAGRAAIEATLSDLGI